MLLWIGLAFAGDAAAVAERCQPSIVTLEVTDLAGRRTGSGTGFLISADGLVVTNNHVIEAGPSHAIFADGTKRDVLGLVATDEAADVAILRIEGSGYPALTLHTGAPPVVGDPVVVIGSPGGLEKTVTEGIISAVRPDGLPPDQRDGIVADGQILQVTAGFAPGSSGSPVMTPAGDVIGVAQSVSVGMQLYFVVNIAEVVALREGADLAAPPTPLSSPLDSVLWSLGVVVAVLGGGWSLGPMLAGLRRLRARRG